MAKKSTGYVRPTRKTMTFARGTFYVVKADIHNRRITTIVGRFGTKGRTRVYNFATRAETREFLEVIEERREMLGYAAAA